MTKEKKDTKKVAKKPAKKVAKKAEKKVSKDAETNIAELIEKAVEDIVMLEVKDLPGMAGMVKQLVAIAEGLDGEKEASALRGSKLVENIIFEESENPDGDIQIVGEILGSLQSIVCDGMDVVLSSVETVQCDEKENTPDSGDEVLDNNGALGVSGGYSNDNDETAQAVLDDDKSTAAPGASVLPPDDEIYRAFVEQQITVLADIENMILAFESDGSDEHIASLRRVIHTMKGEAGVCAIVDIETVCHKVEDYFNGDNISADILFDYLDWMQKAIEALDNRESPVGLQELIERFSSNGEAKPEVSQEDTSPVEKEEAAVSADVQDIAVEAPVEKAQPSSVPIGDTELAKDFVGEAQEHFEIADENLLILENEPGNSDAVNAVFRSFHTIKGVSGFLGLTPVGDLAHKAENLLDDVRKGNRTFAGSVVDVTFKALDMLKLMMSDLSESLSSGSDFPVRPALDGLIAELVVVLEGGEISSQDATSAEAPEMTGKDDVNVEGAVSGEPVAQAQSSKDAGDIDAVPQSAKVAVQQTMKVDAEKIDLLLDTIGELVIAESIVAGAPEIKNLNSQKVAKNLSHLNKISRSLQDMGMAMRMVPVEATFRKMARLVRDLAKKSGKEIEFSMEGKDTELDKGMVEKLGDPLVHMIRNSVDHGIEDNEQDRKAAGKSGSGHVTLKAFHKGGAIHIQIVDDGKGLDKEAILNKAIERGIVSRRNGMSDQDIYALIFEAGFSTAQKITEVSGRGVGMDVVRRNIESLRGNVLIESEKGVGTTFSIVLPLTMAIIDGMLARVASETYIIPTLSIIESFRPTPEMLSTVTDRGEVIMFRDTLLPIFKLGDLFGVKGAVTDPCEGIVIVIEDAGRQTAILVEEILGQQQTVIKSLGEAVGTVEGVSGASIMADGTPGLIIDVSGVVKLATTTSAVAV